MALGWDVYHQEHPNPYEREVKIEKSGMVGDRGKRSDYAFYTAPNYLQARFMAEAKKPSRQLEDPYETRRAIVEGKSEVRRAGGVYYTPEYIVRFIVENTVGKLIDGKTPEEISELRFADIACGSGSFLLGVFDTLIKYHVEWYAANKKRRTDSIKRGFCRETPDGRLQLTLEHKRDILLNNVYGVDLDAQAVEVAQLPLNLKLLEPLNLKLLEEENAVQPKLGGFREQLLPNLNKNIVHGNSLIDFDITDGQLFDSRDLKKLNPDEF